MVPAGLIVIPAIIIGATIFVLAMHFFVNRRLNEESSSDQSSVSAEEIAEAVADTAAEIQETGEDVAFEEDEGEDEDARDEDVNYESAHNDHMTFGSIDDECSEILLAKLDKMPPLPKATIDLLPMLSSPRTSARDIARVISTDPLLGGKILRRVNSCFYSLRSKIDSIQHAIALLGFDNIRAISLRESFASMLCPEAVETLSTNLLWRHMAAVGLLGKHLAQRVRGVDPEMVGSAALLHDIGMLVLMAMDRDELADALRLSVQQRRPICSCEEELYNYNHQVLGGILSRKWNFSDELCDAIGRHHSPFNDDDVDKVSGIIWLSHTLAYKLGFAHRMASFPSDDGEEIAKALGLRWPIIEYINEGILRELQKVLSLWDALSLSDGGAEISDAWREDAQRT